MKLHSLFLFFAGFLALLPIQLLAEPLIIAQPTGATAFNGDASATFGVLATDSDTPTYQWQVMPSGSLTATDISGATSSVLTISTPTVSMSGNKYRCVVTSAVDGSTTYSTFAALNVYSTPVPSPNVVLSLTSIAANSGTNISIHISGLHTLGDTVLIERVFDSNLNSIADLGEPLVQSFVVTDGQASSIGGVRNANVPGDDDGIKDGQITTHFSLPTSPELGRTAGRYLIRISSPTGEFRPVMRLLVVTQPTYGQGITGQIHDDSGSPVPYATVAALDGNGNYVASASANNLGNYVLNLQPGYYSVIAVQPGYTGAMSTAPSFTVGTGQRLTGIIPILTAATCTISGQVRDDSGAALLKGVQLFAQSSAGYVTVASSDSGGNFVASAVGDDWSINGSNVSLPLLGYVPAANDAYVSTVDGSTTPNDMLFSRATALVYGTLKDNLGTPLSGVEIDTNDGNGFYSVQTQTDTSGTYCLGVVGDPANSWWVGSPGSDPALAGYLPLTGQDFVSVSGSATQVNFIAQQITAHLKGTVTKNGVAIPGVTLGTSPLNGDGSLWITATTDNTGSFDFGVMGGTWSIGLGNESAAASNLVGPQITVTVADGGTTSGIAYPVLNATGAIHGTVTDAFNTPFANTGVYGYANISGTNYNAGAQTDGNGNYSFPIINGDWFISVGQSGFSYKTLSVSGTTLVNFVQTTITADPQDQTVTTGSTANFSVTVSAPGVPSFQWQRLPVGSTTWVALTDDGNYNGTASPLLAVKNATTGMYYDSFRCVVTYLFNGTTPMTDTSNPASLYVNPPVTAHIQGRVMNNGVPVVGVVIGAARQDLFSYSWPASTTDSNGYFDIGLQGGTWSVSLDSDSANLHNLVGQQLFETITDGTTLSGITYQALSGNGTIHGTVNDALNSPLSADVFATASINGVNYYANGNTDATGNYSFPVLGGTTWNVGVAMPGFVPQIVSVTSSAQVNFVQSIITGDPADQTVTTDQGASFSVTVNPASTPSFQWQLLAAGSTIWNNINDNQIYTGSTEATLTLNTLSLDMDGDQFRCVVSYLQGSTPQSATSNPASLDVSLPITAHLQGTVSKGGVALSGISMLADPQFQSPSSPSATTNGNGGFDLGVQGGSWAIRISPDSANSNNLVGPCIYEDITDGSTISGIVYNVLNGTGTLYGNVRDASSRPVSGASVWAYTMIGGVEYDGGAVSDANGNYAFPSLSGTAWIVTVPGYYPQFAVVSGSTQVNFVPPTPYQLWLQTYCSDPAQLTDAKVSGPTAKVLSGAGFTNQMAYALGLDPSLAAVSDLPKVGTATVSGTNYLTLKFTRNTSATDIAYIVQTSTDLTNPNGWSTLCTFSAGVWTPSAIVTESVNRANVNNVQVQDTVPIRSAARRFLRLSVIQ